MPWLAVVAAMLAAGAGITASNLYDSGAVGVDYTATGAPDTATAAAMLAAAGAAGAQQPPGADPGL